MSGCCANDLPRSRIIWPVAGSLMALRLTAARVRLSSLRSYGPEDLRAYGPTDLPRREAVEHGDEDLVQLLVRERAGDTVALRQQPFADHRFDRANQRR